MENAARLTPGGEVGVAFPEAFESQSDVECAAEHLGHYGRPTGGDPIPGRTGCVSQGSQSKATRRALAQIQELLCSEPALRACTRFIHVRAASLSHARL